MMILHENKAIFKEIIEETSLSMNIDNHMIEKDYWVTNTLKHLFSSDIAPYIVFKGGTALSKCYHAIHRFSEDIDICLRNIESFKRSGQVKKLKDVTRIVSGFLPRKEVEHEILRGCIRKTYHIYPSLFNPHIELASSIQMEASMLGSAYPSKEVFIQSYISDYLSEKKDHKTLKIYHLKPFSVKVLDIKRNFTEKIFALHQYAQNQAYTTQAHKNLRHIYDLYVLLNRKDIREYIESRDFEDMIQLLREERKKIYSQGNFWLTSHPKSQKVFSSPLQFLNTFSRQEKEKFSTMLINQKMPTDEQLSTIIAKGSP